MNRVKLPLAVLGAFLIIATGVALGNARNSIQPAHVYFGTVQSGDHPNRLVTLHNGTGKAETIKLIGIAGSGGYVFTMPNSPLVNSQAKGQRCHAGLLLPAGGVCSIDVRVHTVRLGWFRSVLRVVYNDGTFNSAELRAHVVTS